MRYLISLLLLIFNQLMLAQDSILVNKNFQFEDGIYLTFDEFQRNEPSLSWAEVEGQTFTNPQTFLTQVVSIYIPNGRQKIEINPRKIYAISIDGLPYIGLHDGEINRALPTFAALKVRGEICYFAYPIIEKKMVTINAYNPKNGVPFRTGMVEREQEGFAEKMLQFQTGIIKDFNINNFLAWIQKDKDLVKTIQNLSAEEQQEKLFKCLLIYDDRNNVYLLN